MKAIMAMPTSSGRAPTPRRRKQITYGKQSRSSAVIKDDDYSQYQMHDVSIRSTRTEQLHRVKHILSEGQSMNQLDLLTVGRHGRPELQSSRKDTKEVLLASPSRNRVNPNDRHRPGSNNASVFDVPSSDEDLPPPNAHKIRPTGHVSGNESAYSSSAKLSRPLAKDTGQSRLHRPSKKVRLFLSSEFATSPSTPLEPKAGSGHPRDLTSPPSATSQGVTGAYRIRVDNTTSRERTLGAYDDANTSAPLQEASAKNKHHGRRKDRQMLLESDLVDFSERAEPATCPARPTALPMSNACMENRSSSALLNRPSTPPRDTALEENSLFSTPRQTQLWSALLEDQESPHIAARSHRKQRAEVPSEHRSAMVRTRLIDVLGPTDESELRSDGVEKEECTLGHLQQRVSVSLCASDAAQQTSVSGSQPSGLLRSQSRLTYAGQRSFLDESNFGADDLLELSLVPDDACLAGETKTQGLYLPSRSAEQRMTLELHDEDDARGMRSIHELRAASDSFRFENDLFLDDIERTGKEFLSRKRNAMLDMCSRLSDPSFRERFIRNGLELRIVLTCHNEADVFVRSAIAAVLVHALVGSTVTQLALQLAQAGSITTLQSLINVENGLSHLARERRSNLSRVAQASVSSFQRKLAEDPIWDGSPPIILSPSILALRAWDLLIRKMRSDGDTSTFLDQSQLLDLTVLLHKHLTILECTTIKECLPGGSLLIVRIIMSLIESSTVAEACALDDPPWEHEALMKLIECFERATALSVIQQDHTFELILRTCLNLANNNESVSEAFSTHSFIRKIVVTITQCFREEENLEGNDSGSTKLDKLLLALGLLLNLAEWSDSTRQAMLTDIKSLDALLNIVAKRHTKSSQADSLAASQLNVAYGYLAVCLGNLCKNVTLRYHMKAKLPGGSLKFLSDAVDDFLLRHREADKGSDGNLSWIAFTCRLAAVGEMMKTFVQDDLVDSGNVT